MESSELTRLFLFDKGSTSFKFQLLQENGCLMQILVWTNLEIYFSSSFSIYFKKKRFWTFHAFISFELTISLNTWTWLFEFPFLKKTCYFLLNDLFLARLTGSFFFVYVWRLVRATDEWRLIGTSLIRVVSIEITQVCLLLPPSDHKFTFFRYSRTCMHTI